MTAASPRIHSLFDRWLQEAPDRAFLYLPDRTLSFADLGRLLDQAEAELRADGVLTGDRVLIVAENCPEHAALILACSRVGAWSCGVNARMAPGEVAAFLATADARVAYFTTAVSPAARAHAHPLPATHSALPPPRGVSPRRTGPCPPPAGHRLGRARPAAHGGTRRGHGRARTPGQQRGRHHLHLGHHRHPQGRDDDARRRGPLWPGVGHLARAGPARPLVCLRAHDAHLRPGHGAAGLAPCRCGAGDAPPVRARRPARRPGPPWRLGTSTASPAPWPRSCAMCTPAPGRSTKPSSSVWKPPSACRCTTATACRNTPVRCT